MAIKFVDIEPEGGVDKPKRPAAPKPVPPADAPPADEAKLPLAKPEPKPRGRKKPLK